MNLVFEQFRPFGSYVFAGDIGGTNLRLAVFGLGAQGPEMVLKAERRSDVKIPEYINVFLKQVKEAYDVSVDSCVIGVAGPINEDTVELTNLDITLDSKEIMAKTGLKKVLFINDIEAAAYAILHEKELIKLGTGEPDPNGTRAIISPGTGLGEALLVWSGEYNPVASEGGHCLLAATNLGQRRFADFLLNQGLCRGLPDYEDVLSGKGIVNLYRYHTECLRMVEDKKIAEEMEHAKDLAPLISKHGLSGKSRPCSATLELFAEFYAQECRNLALKAKATGGVYLPGAITICNILKLNTPAFVKTFIGDVKHPIASLLKSIPVFIVKNPDINLFGAALAGSKL